MSPITFQNYLKICFTSLDGRYMMILYECGLTKRFTENLNKYCSLEGFLWILENREPDGDYTAFYGNRFGLGSLLVNIINQESFYYLGIKLRRRFKGLSVAEVVRRYYDGWHYFYKFKVPIFKAKPPAIISKIMEKVKTEEHG